jgi:HD-GYP domain-containing protein (c-di-GMP phosphodiesterase class II)
MSTDAGRLKDGMVAALDVYDVKGTILLKNGAALTEPAIARLKKNNIIHIYTAEDGVRESGQARGLMLNAELLRVLYYFKSTGGENAEILKRYNQDDIRRFLSYSNDTGSRIAYGHIFKYLAAGIIKNIRSGGKQCFDFIDYRDADTYYNFHAVNAAEISAVTGANLGLSDAELSDLIIGALFCDIKMDQFGFAGEARKLNPAEKDVIKGHAKAGYDMIKRVYGISSGASLIAALHHERNDGSGYPAGLKGGGISMTGRIAAIADVYDALISERPYRKAFMPSEAWDYISNNGGVIFDAAAVNEFKNTVAKYMTGDTVLLADGRPALVCANVYGRPERPYIKIIEKKIKSDIIPCGVNEGFSIVKTIKSAR